MATDATQKYLAGEIYVKNNMCISFECKTCDEQFRNYKNFLDHIFGEHFADWTSSEQKAAKENFKNKRELENTNEMSAIKAETEITKEEQCCNAEVDDLIEVLLPSTVSDSVPEAEEVLYTSGNEDDLIESDKQTLITISTQIETAELLKETAVSSATSSPQKQQQPPSPQEPSNTTLTPLLFKKQTTTKRFKCKICGYAIAGIHNLRQHEGRHSNVKPFGCLHCDRQFYTKTERNHHMRRHTNEKPFVCLYCGKAFTVRSLLTTHEKRHTSEPTYKCDQCDRRYYEPAQLRHHYVSHTKERNHKCAVCEARFSSRKSLRTHMQLHENAQKYECIICHMRFNQRPTMLWHVKSKHNVVLKGKVNVDGDGGFNGNASSTTATQNEPNSADMDCT